MLIDHIMITQKGNIMPSIPILIIPSLLSVITIILCMYGLSNVMKKVPIGVTYASFAGLRILATS